jgi:hypothetical protein
VATFLAFPNIGVFISDGFVDFLRFALKQSIVLEHDWQAKADRQAKGALLPVGRRMVENCI